MKKYIALLAAGLILFPANLAYAEESAEEVVEEVVEEPDQEPETSYAPPPEASDGVGGWSVVVKETGRVVGGHVCTI
jgi:hypothetical protein